MWLRSWLFSWLGRRALPRHAAIICNHLASRCWGTRDRNPDRSSNLPIGRVSNSLVADCIAPKGLRWFPRHGPSKCRWKTSTAGFLFVKSPLGQSGSRRELALKTSSYRSVMRPGWTVRREACDTSLASAIGLVPVVLWPGPGGSLGARELRPAQSSQPLTYAFFASDCRRSCFGWHR